MLRSKKFAVRQVLVEEYEQGVWMDRTASVMPDNERWLHEPQAAADLQSAFARVQLPLPLIAVPMHW